MDDKETRKNGIGAGTPGPGRPKGSVNRTTALLKDAILQAAENAGGEGGIVGYLTLQATENPASFMTLLGKIIPTVSELTGKDGGPIETRDNTAVDLLKARLDAIARRTSGPTAEG